MGARTRYAAGNWKMHGGCSELSELGQISQAAAGLSVRSVICLPATLIDRARYSGVMVGGQDCHPESNGAFTGEISAAMLKDAGAEYVILGHSERRVLHDESDALVKEKMVAAWSEGLTAILCVGESRDQYLAGETQTILRTQIESSLAEGANSNNTLIAYEPVWAIGTGLTPSASEVQQVHFFLRNLLPDPDISILYGGSVKPGNAAQIFALPDVDGGLVGGASLAAAEFVPIMQVLEGVKT